MAKEQLSHANVPGAGELNDTHCDIKIARVGYEAVAQHAVQEASVAGRQLIAVHVAHKVHVPVPIAANAALARDGIRVWVVQQRIQFHGQKSHGQNCKKETTNAFMAKPAPERHME